MNRNRLQLIAITAIVWSAIVIVGTYEYRMMVIDPQFGIVSAANLTSNQ